MSTRVLAPPQRRLRASVALGLSLLLAGCARAEMKGFALGQPRAQAEQVARDNGFIVYPRQDAGDIDLRLPGKQPCRDPAPVPLTEIRSCMSGGFLQFDDKGRLWRVVLFDDALGAETQSFDDFVASIDGRFPVGELRALETPIPPPHWRELVGQGWFPRTTVVVTGDGKRKYVSFFRPVEPTGAVIG